MTEPFTIASVVALGGALLGAITVFTAERRRRIASRTEQVRLAADLLAQHNDHLNAFISDPDAPDDLRDTLIWFSEAAGDELVARDLARSVVAGQPPKETESTEPTLSGFERLRRTRPDLAEHFTSAVSSGLSSMFLRWDETAGLFDRLVARAMSAGSMQEIAFADRVARSEQRLSADRGGQARLRLEHA